MTVTVSGYLQNKSGGYLNAMNIGDPVSVATVFDVGRTGPHALPMTATLGQNRLTAPRINANANLQYLFEFGSLFQVSSFGMNAELSSADVTATFSLVLQSRNTALVQTSAEWLKTTTNPAIFDYQRFMRIEGTDLSRTYPDSSFSASVFITSISIVPAPALTGAPPLIAAQPTSRTYGDVHVYASAQSESALSLRWQTSSNRGLSWSDFNSFYNDKERVYATNQIGKWFRVIASNASGSTVSAKVVAGGVVQPFADFDLDGRHDIVWENPTTGQRGLWLMNGTSARTYVALDPVGPPWEIAATGDFNGDDRPDVVWQNPQTGQRGIWIMNGTTVSTYVALNDLAPPWQIVGTGDFNADGKIDILLQNPDTGQRGVWLMNGSVVSSYVALDSVGTPWQIAGSADFNHDYKPDIIWQNPVTGQRGIWVMNGTAVLTYAALEPVGPPWQIAGAGDFNGDGDPDILWQNPSTGQRGIWIMSGTAVSTYVALEPVGPPWRMRL
ncbi:MAG: VCBS repeat-containing protein [Opitutaceae bacterium]